MKENEVLYGRISKVENNEGGYTKERKEFIKHVERQVAYSDKLKLNGRLRKLEKINRENEHMYKRIENAQPSYSRKKFQDEYKHILLFKSGR